MKKILSVLSVLSILTITQASFAEGIGYVDYSYISANYSLAQKYNNTLKTKAQAIKTYASNQDEKIKSVPTKLEKDKLRKEGLNQVRAKQKELNSLRAQYETELTSKVQMASEQVRLSKKLDMIIKADARVTGGIDCTKEVLNALKNVK